MDTTDTNGITDQPWRERNVITSQDEFNQTVVKALHNLYILTLGSKSENDVNYELEDINVRDRLNELNDYAWGAAVTHAGITPSAPSQPWTKGR